MRIDYAPLSVNKCWQGRRFKTTTYKDYEYDVLRILPKREMVKGFVKIEFIFYLNKMSFSRSDIDNFIKPIQDIIVKAGYIEDDRKIIEFSAKKILANESYIEFNIYPLQK